MKIGCMHKSGGLPAKFVPVSAVALHVGQRLDFGGIFSRGFSSFNNFLSVFCFTYNTNALRMTFFFFT